MDQITVEAKFFKITQIAPVVYVLELNVTDPEKTVVNEVELDIGPDWDPDARVADLPEGWKRLSKKEGGTLSFKGAETTLPLKLDIVSRSKIPEVIPSVKLKISKGKYIEVKNIPVIRAKLPVVKWEERRRKTDLKIIVRKANIRSKPGIKSRIITSASQGEIIRSDKKIEDWYRIPLPSDPSGKKKYGYIHSRIVAEVKKAVKVPVEIPEVTVKPEKKELPPIVKEPGKIKSEPLIKRLLKKASVKITAGPGFFMNGMGDLEKLRTETEDFVTAMGQVPVIPGKANMQSGDPSETVPEYQTAFNWDPLRFNTHFQVGINFDINQNFSAGLSIGNFGAGNDNIDYSFISECEGENEWWSWIETDSTRFTESYDLSAFPIYATFNYGSNPRYSTGTFSPEFSFGIGPIFVNMKRTFTEDMEFKRDISSTHYQSSSDLTQMSRNMTGTYNATGLGIQISGGIDYQISPTLTVGLDGFFNFASFGNWKGSEEGAWNSKIQRSNNGEVFQDESDSGSWSFSDLPLYYYYGPFAGTNRPFMFVGDEPPLNGVSPSINWNTWGIQLTVKISLGGKPKPADTPDVTDTPDPSSDPGTNPTDTPPPTIHGEDLEKEDKIWNAYVFVGDMSESAGMWTRGIQRAANEAQEDFIKAGYNVILDYEATFRDFYTILRDSQARALWFAGHGNTLDGVPVPVIYDADQAGIAPIKNSATTQSGLTIVFRKKNLNQVTFHACYQKLPQWMAAFTGAEYISWAGMAPPIVILCWQIYHEYPEIDPKTGREKGK